MFRRKKALTPVVELNELQAATPARRRELLDELSEGEAKGLVAYLLATR